MPLFVLPTSLRLLEQLHRSSNVPVVVVAHNGEVSNWKGHGSHDIRDAAWSAGSLQPQLAAVWANPVALQQFHGGTQSALDNLLSGDANFRNFINQHFKRLLTGEASSPSIQNTCRLATHGCFFYAEPHTASSEIEVSAAACILEPRPSTAEPKHSADLARLKCCFPSFSHRRLTSRTGAPQPGPFYDLKEACRPPEEICWRQDTPLVALLLQFHALHHPDTRPSRARPPHTQSPPPTVPPTSYLLDTCTTRPSQRGPSIRDANPAITTATTATTVIGGSAIPMTTTATTATTVIGGSAVVPTGVASPAVEGQLPSTASPQPSTHEGMGFTGAQDIGVCASREEAAPLFSTLLTNADAAAPPPPAAPPLPPHNASAAFAATAVAVGSNAADALFKSTLPSCGLSPQGQSWQRSCMVLAALPLCVTIFDREGRVLFQNAASIYYFGARSIAPQSGLGANATVAAAADAAEPEGMMGTSSNTQRPIGTNSRTNARDTKSLGLLSKLLALGFNPWRKKLADGHGSPTGGTVEQSRPSSLLAPGIGPLKGGTVTERTNVLLDLFAFEMEKLEEMWDATAVEGGTWQGMVWVPRTLNAEPLRSFVSRTSEASCPEVTSGVGVSQHLETRLASRSAAGATVAPNGSSGAFQQRHEMNERPSAASGVAATTSECASRLSRAYSICVLPSCNSSQRVQPGEMAETSTAVGSGAVAVARPAMPFHESRPGTCQAGPQKVASRVEDCDDVLVTRLSDVSKPNMNCSDLCETRDVDAHRPATISPGPIGMSANVIEDGGAGDGTGGARTPTDDPRGISIARKLSILVMRVVAAIGAAPSTVSRRGHSEDRHSGTRDGGVANVLQRLAPSQSRLGSSMSVGSVGVCTEAARGVDDMRQPVPETGPAPLLRMAAPSFGDRTTLSMTQPRTRMPSPGLLQSLGAGMRRLASGRSGTSIGLGKGPTLPARATSVELSWVSFCNAAGVSIARGFSPQNFQALGGREGGRGSPPSGAAATLSSVEVVNAANTDIGQQLTDLCSGDTAAMAAASAPPRSGSRPRRRSHGSAAQRRWASVNTLSTSTWQVAFSGGSITTHSAYCQAMVSEHQPRLALQDTGVVKSPPRDLTAMEGRTQSQTPGAALRPPPRVLNRAAGPRAVAAAAGPDASVVTPSTSDCCLMDPVGSGLQDPQSSSPARGRWGQPPSSTVMDFDPCEATAPAAALPPRQRHANQSEELWVASALAATSPSPTGVGSDATTDKLLPLPSDLQSRLIFSVEGGPGRSGRVEAGAGSGNAGNGSGSPFQWGMKAQLLVAYNSCSSDTSRFSHGQSFESNLAVAMASNNTAPDRTRGMGQDDPSVTLLASSPSRMGNGASDQGSSTVTNTGPSSRVVAFAASLRTAPTLPNKMTAATGLSVRAKSDRRSLRPCTGMGGGTLNASLLSRSSFSQSGPQRSISTAAHPGGFWTSRYTTGLSGMCDEVWDDVETVTDGGPDGDYVHGHRKRCGASCYNDSSRPTSPARDNVSKLCATSERCATMTRCPEVYNRMAATHHGRATALGKPSDVSGISGGPTSPEASVKAKASGMVCGVGRNRGEIQVCEEAATPAAERITLARPSPGPTSITETTAGCGSGGSVQLQTYETRGSRTEKSGLSLSSAQRSMRPREGSENIVNATEAPAVAAAAASSTGTTTTTTTNASSAEAATGDADFSVSECWHEVVAVGLVDPSSGRRGVVVMQRDVTAKVVAERHVAQVSETEHRLLEQIFPRHVLQYIMEESGMCAAPDDAGLGEPDSDVDRDRISDSAIAGAEVSNACGFSSRWRPHVRDCNRLAVWHPQVTVLFADIQGFTPMCKVLPPDVVMAFLNTLFTRFDAMLDKYHVYKVETIGDCYMVAGGLIREDEDGMAAVQGGGHVDPDQALNIFAFAKAMLVAASSVSLPTTRSPVKVRVGIHSGPVVSGVVGTRMPRFCLFGDTVNTASRMESTGVPGCVHISDDCFQLMKQRDSAVAEGWEATGGIEVKGKGLMRTHLWTPPMLRPTTTAAETTTAATKANSPLDATNNTTTVKPPTNGTDSSTAAAAKALSAAPTPRRQLKAPPGKAAWGPALTAAQAVHPFMNPDAVRLPRGFHQSGYEFEARRIADAPVAVAFPRFLQPVVPSLAAAAAAPAGGRAWTLLTAQNRERHQEQAAAQGVTSVGGGSGCGGLADSAMSPALAAALDAIGQPEAGISNSGVSVARSRPDPVSLSLASAGGNRVATRGSAGARSVATGASGGGGGANRVVSVGSVAGGGAGSVAMRGGGVGGAAVCHRLTCMSEAKSDVLPGGSDSRSGNQPLNLNEDLHAADQYIDSDPDPDPDPSNSSTLAALCNTPSTDLRWSSRHGEDLLSTVITAAYGSVAWDPSRHHGVYSSGSGSGRRGARRFLHMRQRAGSTVTISRTAVVTAAAVSAAAAAAADAHSSNSIDGEGVHEHRRHGSALPSHSRHPGSSLYNPSNNSTGVGAHAEAIPSAIGGSEVVSRSGQNASTGMRGISAIEAANASICSSSALAEILGIGEFLAPVLRRGRGGGGGSGGGVGGAGGSSSGRERLRPLII